MFLIFSRHLATTQFESTDARAAFPCFDEPEFKAKFTVTMVHDRSLNAISNMPLDRKTITKDGLVESHFMQSVKMSTYLVAFVVSDFGFMETTTKTRGIKVGYANTADQHMLVDISIRSFTLCFNSFHSNPFSHSTPLHSGPIPSSLIDQTPLYCIVFILLHSTPLPSAHHSILLHSILCYSSHCHSIPLNSTPFHLRPLDSRLLCPIPFNSSPLHFVPLHSTLFHSFLFLFSQPNYPELN